MEAVYSDTPEIQALHLPQEPGADPGLAPGRTLFNRLTLIQKLGDGRCSTVWLADDSRFRREVALKFFLSSNPGANETERQSWRDLLRKLRILNHPQICLPLEYLSEGQWAVIASNYIPGGTLAAWLRAKPDTKTSFLEIKPILLQIGRALAAAHQAGITHGNLNAFNVLVSNGQISITDFGFAPSADPSIKVEPGSGLALKEGTLSPEQRAGGSPSVSSDLFAWAALAFQALTGGNPGASQENSDKLQAIAALPVEWREGILTALSEDPALRPASLRDVLDKVSPRETGPLIPASQPVNPIPPPRRKRLISGRGSRRKQKTRRFWLKALLFLSLLSLPCILTLMITKSVDEAHDLEQQRAREEVDEKAKQNLEKAKLRELEARVTAQLPAVGLTPLSGIAPAFATPDASPEKSATPARKMNSGAEDFFRDGQAKQKVRDYEGAFQSYELAVVLESDWTDLLEARAVTLSALNRLEEAVDEFSKVLVLEPTRLSSLLGRAQSYAQLENIEFARKDFEAVLKIKPDSVEARLGLEALPSPK